MGRPVGGTSFCQYRIIKKIRKNSPWQTRTVPHHPVCRSHVPIRCDVTRFGFCEDGVLDVRKSEMNSTMKVRPSRIYLTPQRTNTERKTLPRSLHSVFQLREAAHILRDRVPQWVGYENHGGGPTPLAGLHSHHVKHGN